ncbi:molybdopterin converting factor subunit 1 [Aquibacillus koreensis]|uniref:Molybdopterin synthase sulfur carrier subunit n=1 Tax=Aquibacillus koreensis TaxID=279446 RepID=A0A9X3WIE7_9BACI|nr:molybdopterin converting factor subunit 1 [Aquibacillus koreensis]MCT2535891.1 molybdopterin converting factor subunit 1 [Aquibacillus koreensis]MDC3420347.1 molybdopterin converting factor subunit 1 [Aquibacillus koreensis]
MITVLLFAQLQEDAGTDQLELNIDEINVRELKERLQSDYNLSKLDQVMVAVNEEYALDDDVIKKGDTVAIIPPVSGG